MLTSPCQGMDGVIVPIKDRMARRGWAKVGERAGGQSGKWMRTRNSLAMFRMLGLRSARLVAGGRILFLLQTSRCASQRRRFAGGGWSNGGEALMRMSGHGDRRQAHWPVRQAPCQLQGRRHPAPRATTSGCGADASSSSSSSSSEQPASSHQPSITACCVATSCSEHARRVGCLECVES